MNAELHYDWALAAGVEAMQAGVRLPDGKPLTYSDVLMFARANMQTDWACPGSVSLVGYQDGTPIPGEGITQIDVKSAKYLFASGLGAWPSDAVVHQYHFGGERGACRRPDAVEDLLAMIRRDAMAAGAYAHGLMDRFTHEGYCGFPRRANAALGIGKLGFFEKIGAHLMKPERAWGHMLRPERDNLADNRQTILEGCTYLWQCIAPGLPLGACVVRLQAAKNEADLVEWIKNRLDDLWVPFEPFRPGTAEWERWCEVVS